MRTSSKAYRWLAGWLGALGLLASQNDLAAAGAAKDYRQLKYPPLRRVQAPEPARLVLANGMRVFLVADPELPLVSARALVRVGSRWDPADKTGLARMVGQVIRTGGTPAHSGDQLDEELDRLGAVVETSVGENSGGGSVSVLKEDIDKGLSILADLLRHPAFPADKLELAKIQERDAIARRNDDAGSIAQREFTRVLHGKDSPYARVTEYATIDAITRDDLVTFHGQFFQPENILLGVWGDFDPSAMRGKLETIFGSWPKGGQPPPKVPAMDLDFAKRVGCYAINKDDVNQSWVLMGHLGGRRDSPDFFALELMDAILGDGFASRLFSNVRSKEGLAYTVYSSWAPGWDHEGVFLAGGHTKSESTLKIVGAIQREIQQLLQAGVTEDELRRVKDGKLKGMAFENDSTGKIVNRLMTYEYYGYPRDFLQRYEEGIRRVSCADIQRVARHYLHPDQLAVLVLGKQKDFDQPLTSLGPVKEIDITIPGAPAASDK